ncbi:PhzF family phenazine biosynthesis protein [Nitrospina watsonii]|uniref:PhzF family phenazine biosynthesis protein n=1 Tax=Nitrospina watsonii TaxID=1323948 RepID=A0ABM9HDL7_9BACT|nr:PhzF family phenazine biosynthesis protein [Nitrospina watsonii]CAI2718335.1 PhzF family phenazine biosynthesis protein [Nitrospina watsonii]
MEFAFYQVDVFTDQPLAGNPLAVFTDAQGLSAAQMQAIAREMNLSETTFLVPASRPESDFDVRIFTPDKELPFAGHPTLGTAHILYETGKLDASRTEYQFGMKIGAIRVTRSGTVFFMQQPLPQFQPPRSDAAAIAEALGLAVGDLHPDVPAQVVSTGLPALMVPLRNRATAGRIDLNLSRLRDVLGGVEMIYPFSLDPVAPNARVHARGFAPFIGIPEDPATGSVAGAMGSYLVEHKLLDESEWRDFRLEQGLEMGRPSEIRVAIGVADGAIRSVQVGGTARTVIEGCLKL